jgi:NAD(P)-dependent dehydrogenase (short-subunit alcohol dehydrogenase family)
VEGTQTLAQPASREPQAALGGRVALVTGAAGDLGSTIASTLAAHGATVLCADPRDCTTVAAALPGGRGHAVTLDVTDADAVERVFAAAASDHGRLDILVNNAGVAQPPLALADTPDDVLESVLAVNVKGVLHCARAAARLMIEQRSGRIINIASQAGKCGVANFAVYCASKAAVVAATQAQALELAPHAITVNAVCPGAMLTEMTRETVRLQALASGSDAAELLESQAAAVPLGRLGTADELGEMVAWIASDRSSFTTGASFNITGGMSVFF